MFPCCSTRENLSIDVSNTNVGLILNKAMVIYFLGVRTDRVLESSHGNMSAHKNFNSKLKISGLLSIPIFLPRGRGCINRPFEIIHEIIETPLFTFNHNSLISKCVNKLTRFPFSSYYLHVHYNVLYYLQHFTQRSSFLDILVLPRQCSSIFYPTALNKSQPFI